MNFWAILVASILYFILGALWYSHILLGKQWMKLKGYKEEELQSEPFLFLGAFIDGLLELLLLSAILELFLAYSTVNGLIVGVILGATAILIKMTTTLYEEKEYKLVMIHGGYHIIALLLGGLIIGAWP